MFPESEQMRESLQALKIESQYVLIHDGLHQRGARLKSPDRQLATFFAGRCLPLARRRLQRSKSLPAKALAITDHSNRMSGTRMASFHGALLSSRMSSVLQEPRADSEEQSY